MLAAIAQKTFGHYAVPFIAVTLAVSCLATATILAALFADFVKEDICQNKISRPHAILFTVITSFSLSLLGFETICNWLGYILERIYPFLMAFSIYQLASKFKTNPKAIRA
jgi:branched-subunit amino acid permease